MRLGWGKQHWLCFHTVHTLVALVNHQTTTKTSMSSSRILRNSWEKNELVLPLPMEPYSSVSCRPQQLTLLVQHFPESCFHQLLPQASPKPSCRAQTAVRDAEVVIVDPQKCNSGPKLSMEKMSNTTQGKKLRYLKSQWVALPETDRGFTSPGTNAHPLTSPSSSRRAETSTQTGNDSEAGNPIYLYCTTSI